MRLADGRRRPARRATAAGWWKMPWLRLVQCLADLLQPIGNPIDDVLQKRGEQVAGTAEPGLAAA